MDITKENLKDIVCRLPECCKKRILESHRRYTGFVTFDHIVVAGLACRKENFCDEAVVFTTARVKKILESKKK